MSVSEAYRTDAAAFVVACRRAAAWLSALLGAADVCAAHAPAAQWAPRAKAVRADETLVWALSDGVLLCELMARLAPGSVPMVHGGVGRPPREAFRKRENVSFAMAAMRDLRIGLTRHKFTSSEVIGCRAALPLLGVLLDLAAFVALARPELPQFPAGKKFKPTKAELARATVLQDAYAAHLQAAAEQASRHAAAAPATALAETLAGDAAAVRKVVKVQAVVRMRLAKLHFHRLVRNRYFRERTARELLTTERTYHAGLVALDRDYAVPLRIRRDLLSAEEHNVVFGDLAGLADVSAEFVGRLERRLQHWRHATCVGDLFFKLCASLKLYSLYVKSFADADATLKRKLAESKEFERALQQCRDDSSVANDLVSLLITPVQRIPRYELLLRELAERTEPDHPDAEHLKRAAQQVADVAAYVNEKQREADKQRELERVQADIAGRPRNFVQPHRTLVLDDDVMVGAKRDVRHVYLFTDLLLVAKPLGRMERLTDSKHSWRYQASISIDTARLNPIDSRSLELAGKSRFDIVPVSGVLRDVALLLTFRSDAELAQWLQRLAERIEAAKGATLPPFPAPIVSSAERAALKKKLKDGDFVITPPVFNEQATEATKRMFQQQAEPTATAVSTTKQLRQGSDSEGDDDGPSTAIFDPSKLANGVGDHRDGGGGDSVDAGIAAVAERLAALSPRGSPHGARRRHSSMGEDDQDSSDDSSSDGAERNPSGLRHIASGRRSRTSSRPHSRPLSRTASRRFKADSSSPSASGDGDAGGAAPATPGEGDGAADVDKESSRGRPESRGRPGDDGAASKVSEKRRTRRSRSRTRCAQVATGSGGGDGNGGGDNTDADDGGGGGEQSLPRRGSLTVSRRRDRHRRRSALVRNAEGAQSTTALHAMQRSGELVRASSGDSSGSSASSNRSAGTSMTGSQEHTARHGSGKFSASGDLSGSPPSSDGAKAAAALSSSPPTKQHASRLRNSTGRHSSAHNSPRHSANSSPRVSRRERRRSRNSSIIAPSSHADATDAAKSAALAGAMTKSSSALSASAERKANAQTRVETRRERRRSLRRPKTEPAPDGGAADRVGVSPRIDKLNIDTEPRVKVEASEYLGGAYDDVNEDDEAEEEARRAAHLRSKPKIIGVVELLSDTSAPPTPRVADDGEGSMD